MPKKQAAKFDGPKAYSYIRFSTPEQSHGNSEIRQLELAKNFAAENNLELDQSLKPDRGVSGFHGKNRAQGSLGIFLNLIEQGKIAKGSMLIVENVDRLSREKFTDAFETLSKIIRAGIAIHTIQPRMIYDEESLNKSAIFMLVGQMSAAHGESKNKSERLKDARERERKIALDGGRHPNPKNIPGWLEYIHHKENVSTNTKKFRIKPKAKPTLRQIFRWKIAGVGTRRICQKLNEAPEGKYWKSPKADAWRPSYITKLLKNRQLIGEWQQYQIDIIGHQKKRKPIGDPIQDYFPLAIDPILFNQAQELLCKNTTKGGQTGKFYNALRGLGRCAYCQGAMHYEDKGRGNKKGGPYLLCRNGADANQCKTHRIRYSELLNLILDSCNGLDPAEILPREDDREEVSRVLAEQIKGFDATIKANQFKIANLVNQISVTPDASRRNHYDARIGKLESENQEFAEQSRKATAELKKLTLGKASIIQLQQDISALKNAIEPADAIDARMKLNYQLRDLISSIEIFAEGYPESQEKPSTARKRSKGTIRQEEKAKRGRRKAIQIEPAISMHDEIQDYIEVIYDETGYEIDQNAMEFIRWIKNRRQTKEGRFYRIEFKTGRSLDLAPEDSLADCFRKISNAKKPWTYRRLNGKSLDLLYDQFSEEAN